MLSKGEFSMRLENVLWLLCANKENLLILDDFLFSDRSRTGKNTMRIKFKKHQNLLVVSEAGILAAF